MEIFRHTLPNGIRLVHHPVASPVSHCGLFINAGTRDETDREHGMAHFIEHTIFKGTVRRNVFQVLNRLENVGADLNAYTTKEETCIYATFLSDDYVRALDLFQDIFFNSVFTVKEIEKEKQVVMDEIRSYLDNPAEQIFDDFEDLLFSGHPLGKNVLGSVKTIRKINRDNILDFIHRNYRLEEVVIASVGEISFKRLVKMATRYFDSRPERGSQLPRRPVDEIRTFTKQKKKRTAQVHCLLGVPAYHYSDPHRIPLALLNNMLGGPLMNSRLSLALRERNGLTYQNESNYTAYTDAGLLTIYFGTESMYYERALEIVHKELHKLRTRKLSGMQLHTIQKQFTGQLLIARESNLSVMLAMGKSFLIQDHFDPIDETIMRIQQTSADELMDISNELFPGSGISMLTFGR